MDRGQSFVAYTQSPKLMQPGGSAFHYPPGLAKIAAMRCSSFGNLVVNAALLQCQTMGATIVGTIGLNGLGFFSMAARAFLELGERHQRKRPRKASCAG